MPSSCCRAPGAVPLSDPGTSQDQALQLVVWGTRGSIPSAPDDPSIFGARTSCVEIRAAGRRLVFDAGSGIVELGMSLLADTERSID
ncbi:MAG: hypothetical protein ABW179_08925, partial [Methylobacterium sp.]